MTELAEIRNEVDAFINNFNYMDTISNVMFWISNGFLIPVVVGLLFFFVWSVLLLGGFVSRYVQRARMEKELASLLEDMDKTKVAQLQLPEALSKTRFGQCMSRITASTYSEAAVGKLISEYELSCSKELNQAKILVKFGPILGLMGTLIPMGLPQATSLRWPTTCRWLLRPRCWGFLPERWALSSIRASSAGRRRIWSAWILWPD